MAIASVGGFGYRVYRTTSQSLYSTALYAAKKGKVVAEHSRGVDEAVALFVTGEAKVFAVNWSFSSTCFKRGEQTAPRVWSPERRYGQLRRSSVGPGRGQKRKIGWMGGFGPGATDCSGRS